MNAIAYGKKKFKYIISIIFTIGYLCLVSCFKESVNKKINETVMSRGMVINAANANGAITVTANHELVRTYKWDSQKVTVQLRKRDKRWNGSFGIYSPGGGGNIHTVVEEGQQHFTSEKEAIEWLYWQEKTMCYVYSSNGLVVGWHIAKNANPTLKALSVQVWQFYINGQKPSQMSGARDDLIAVNYNNDK